MFFLAFEDAAYSENFICYELLLKYTNLNNFSAADETEMEIRSFSAKKDRIYVF
jgi:hypothetical protein